MAAIPLALGQQARLDEVRRAELHYHARSQYSVREARGRAECAVASADHDRQRAHRALRSLHSWSASALPSVRRPSVPTWLIINALPKVPRIALAC